MIILYVGLTLFMATIGLDEFLHNLIILSMAKNINNANGTPKILNKTIITTSVPLELLCWSVLVLSPLDNN